MKKIISFMLSVLIFTAAFSMPYGTVNAEKADEKALKATAKVSISEGFEAVLENDKFTLYYRGSDAVCALLNKNTGYIWYSNPQSEDAKVSGNTANIIKSQLVFSYYNGVSQETMTSYEYGIANENIPEYSVENDTLKVNYIIGDAAFSTDMLPSVILKETMEEEILSKLDEADRETVLGRYIFYEREALDEETLKMVEVNFPAINKHDIYVFNSATPSYIAEGIYEIFLKAGYDLEALQRYCDESGMENRYEEKPYFNAVLEYSLSQNGLTVKLDPKNVEFAESYPPTTVSVLPFFAASDDKTDGYMLVPDGSGAVINFNNGKTAEDAYEKLIYTVDSALNEEQSEKGMQETSLPFFAIASQNGSILASIDSGYEIAGVKADVSGKNSSYNTVNPYFTLFSNDVVSISSNQSDSFIKYSENIFSDVITVNYLIYDGYCDYSKLAVSYRDYLKEQGILKDNTDLASSMNLSFIGAVETTKSFLGIPYKAMSAYTTLSEAKEILNELDIDNTDIRLTDFVNGGANQKKVSTLKLQRSVGRLKKISSLYDDTNTAYLSVFAQYQADVSKSKSAISISQEVAYKLNYNLLNGYKENNRYSGLISAKLFDSYSKKIVKQIKKNNIEALNLRDIGYHLNSDYRSGSELDRHNVRVEIQEYMAKLSENAKLSVDKGSIYSLPYISKIWDIPMSSSNYRIEDGSVPFYQIVISGSVSYAASALNESSQDNEQFLKALEYGAEPQFTLTYRIFEDTNYYKEDYYGYYYKNHIAAVKELAQRYSEVSAAIGDSAIISHKSADKTAVTEYENGVKIYVNYTNNTVKINGNTVDAENFLIVK